MPCASTSGGGFHLAALHRGAVDDSRDSLKPEIPTHGLHGIAIRDELELERLLPQARGDGGPTDAG